MGLFSSLLSAIPVVGDVIQGATSAKAAGKASAAQQAAAQAGINGINSNLATTQAAFSPYEAAGTNALAAQQDLLGLGSGGTDWGAYVNGNPDALAQWNSDASVRATYGNDIAAYGADHYKNDGSRRDLSPYTTTADQSQQSAIDALKASPLYTSLYGSGLDAVNQSAAATGGLRGGNQALAQSNFGSSLLSQVIQQQLGNLGGLTSQGLNATGAVANAGANAATANANLLTQQGAAKAGGITSQAAIWNNTSNNLQSSIASLFGGSTGGGINTGALSSGTSSALAGLNNSLSLGNIGISGW